MFKKKRLFMLAVLAAAVIVGLRFGWDVTAAGVALFVVLLLVLHVRRLILAQRGFAALATYADRYRLDALQKRIDERPAPDTFSFVVLGDERNNRRMAACVYAQAMTEKPAFLFNTGDLVRHGSPGEFIRNHLCVLDNHVDVPVFCVPGNHDRGARRDFAAFRAIYGADRFAFSYGPCHFVGINNADRERVDEEDLAYLEQQLSGCRAAHKFVFIHIPPAYFEERIVNDGRLRGFKKRADRFKAIMETHGVTEVFMAHIHGYATADIDGVRYTLTAGAGAPLSKRLAKADRCHHYCVRHISADNVHREVVKLRHNEWERFAVPETAE